MEDMVFQKCIISILNPTAIAEHTERLIEFCYNTIRMLSACVFPDIYES